MKCQISIQENGFFITMDYETALLVAASLIEQVAKKDPNTRRPEIQSVKVIDTDDKISTKSYLSIAAVKSIIMT